MINMRKDGRQSKSVSMSWMRSNVRPPLQGLGQRIVLFFRDVYVLDDSMEDIKLFIAVAPVFPSRTTFSWLFQMDDSTDLLYFQRQLFSELYFLGLAIQMMDTSICAFNCKELVVFVPGSQMYLCQAHKCICSRITNVMPSHYRLMLLQSLLSTNHYEFLISLHDRSSQSRTNGPVAGTTKKLFSLIFLSIYEKYILCIFVQGLMVSSCTVARLNRKQ